MPGMISSQKNYYMPLDGTSGTYAPHATRGDFIFDEETSSVSSVESFDYVFDDQLYYTSGANSYHIGELWLCIRYLNNAWTWECGPENQKPVDLRMLRWAPNFPNQTDGGCVALTGSLPQKLMTFPCDKNVSGMRMLGLRTVKQKIIHGGILTVNIYPTPEVPQGDGGGDDEILNYEERPQTPMPTYLPYLKPQGVAVYNFTFVRQYFVNLTYQPCLLFQNETLLRGFVNVLTKGVTLAMNSTRLMSSPDFVRRYNSDAPCVTLFVLGNFSSDNEITISGNETTELSVQLKNMSNSSTANPLAVILKGIAAALHPSCGMPPPTTTVTVQYVKYGVESFVSWPDRQEFVNKERQRKIIPPENYYPCQSTLAYIMYGMTILNKETTDVLLKKNWGGQICQAQPEYTNTTHIRWYCGVESTRTLTYTNWEPGEPKNLYDNCVFLRANTGKWYTDKCRSEYDLCKAQPKYDNPLLGEFYLSWDASPTTLPPSAPAPRRQPLPGLAAVTTASSMSTPLDMFDTSQMYASLMMLSCVSQEVAMSLEGLTWSLSPLGAFLQSASNKAKDVAQGPLFALCNLFTLVVFTVGVVGFTRLPFVPTNAITLPDAVIRASWLLGRGTLTVIFRGDTVIEIVVTWVCYLATVSVYFGMWVYWVKGRFAPPVYHPHTTNNDNGKSMPLFARLFASKGHWHPDRNYKIYYFHLENEKWKLMCCTLIFDVFRAFTSSLRMVGNTDACHGILWCWIVFDITITALFAFHRPTVIPIGYLPSIILYSSHLYMVICILCEVSSDSVLTFGGMLGCFAQISKAATIFGGHMFNRAHGGTSESNDTKEKHQLILKGGASSSSPPQGAIKSEETFNSSTLELQLISHHENGDDKDNSNSIHSNGKGKGMKNGSNPVEL
eukprot:PhF_6_TR36551/c0_g1_i4/m.53938